MAKSGSQPVCAQEALDLLNCVADSAFDQEKCLIFLNSLRTCVLNKKVKKFSIAEQSQQADAKKQNNQETST
ncbi:hypothetical protein GIB67_006362 [Kingdonia uniflora]|uniref:Cysteine alpha-hairpin motif superfamily n=1 Tax=Kingdonia uniflora TaxID=39325 RepID=A0A7J7P0L9_9MAGN|nr:hypothetical protein GIB67_006362 [Kingdonia uniflora]